MKFFAAAAFVLFFSTLFSFQVIAQNKKALVIGNAEYQSAPLKNPVNDALDMNDALIRLGYETTVGTNLSSDEMIDLVQNFQRNIRGGDSVVFYYAGHGIQLGGENYLIPVNADLREERDLEFEAVQVSRVASSIEESGVRQSLMILDACRDNPFLAQSRSGTRGLSISSARSGSVIVYATAPGQVAFDGDGRNGLFTSALLNQLEVPGIEVHDMIREVRAEVASRTENQQVPFATSSITDPMYLSALAGEERESTPRGTFNLTLNTMVNGVSVFADGSFLGSSPLNTQLPEGNYKLSLRHPSLAPASVDITGRAGDSVPVDLFDLAPSMSERLKPLVTAQELLTEKYRKEVRKNQVLRNISTITFSVSVGSAVIAGLSAAAVAELYYGDYAFLESDPAYYGNSFGDPAAFSAELTKNLKFGTALLATSAGIMLTSGITSLITFILSSPRVAEKMESDLENINLQIMQVRRDQ
jgi:hypothetical protein